ncbi:MAG: hypothetical protein SF123_14335 [Chloroflexota bacterium]|nr:hypothetical protein [Chloroflexota bacterium]
MPLSVDWYIPYRVAEARLWGVLSVEEMQHYADECVRVLTESETHAPGKRTYMIMDALELESIPPVYLMLKQALPVLRFKSRDAMFLITRNQAIRNILELTAHVTKFKLHTFATREEALRAVDDALRRSDLAHITTQ